MRISQVFFFFACLDQIFTSVHTELVIELFDTHFVWVSDLTTNHLVSSH